jgi:hypothetical protein
VNKKLEFFSQFFVGNWEKGENLESFKKGLAKLAKPFINAVPPVRNAKPIARWGRKATGLFKDEKIAGLPGSS